MPEVRMERRPHRSQTVPKVLALASNQNPETDLTPMKPAPPIPEPTPVQTLRKYGLNSTADEVAEVYRQHADLRKALQEMLDLQERMGIHETPDDYSEVLSQARALLTRINPPQKKP
jgi:hypothetical protein